MEPQTHLQDIISIILVLTAIGSYLNYRFVRLPQAIGMTLFTLFLSIMIIALNHMGFSLKEKADYILGQIDFHETILKGMLSYLLFAGALHINTLELSKQRVVIMSLATVGVLISTVLVACLTYSVAVYLDKHISFAYCLVFGALISPTDPIAVLSILKNINTPKSLEMKIAGESLFNDGMAIVLFLMMLQFATGDAMTEHNYLQAIWLFLWQVIGGFGLGCFLGFVVSYYMRRAANFEVACMMTLALASGGYSLAHFVDVSGPIAMVMAGLVVGDMMRQGHMLETTINRLDGFWILLDELLNSVLFVLIGLEMLRLTLSPTALALSLAAIVIVQVARYLSVFIPTTILRRFKGFSPLLLIMTWGGIRGGVSIALALSIPQSKERDLIITVTYAVVLFSIVVQGLTIGPLTKRILARQAAANNEAPV